MNSNKSPDEYLGQCAKLHVTCHIYSKSGEVVSGANWCMNPQDVCPREKGEDYTKCKTICKQLGHAEEVAVWLSTKEHLQDSTAIVINQSHSCRNCQETLYKAGVLNIQVHGKFDSP